MTARREAYTSTVMSVGSIAVGMVMAIVLAVYLRWMGAPVIVVAVSAASVVACAVYVSTVRLVVGADHLVLGSGPWAWPSRVVSYDDIVEVGTRDLSLSQVVGLGTGSPLHLTRLTVRAGPTLCVVLRSGEQVRVSTPHPDQAVRLITGSAPGATIESTSPNATLKAVASDRRSDPRPWFGSKRVGFGIRPQTWQGWAITIAGALAMVEIAHLLRGA